MAVMPRSGFSKSLLARLLTLALAIGLLSGTFDLHSLLHQRQDLAGVETHGAHHPEPDHFDHGSIDVPCLACLFGLKSQNRPTEVPGVITRPHTRARLAVTEITVGVSEISYRLPLSRAPPLS